MRYRVAVRGDQDRRNVYAVTHEVLVKLQSIHIRHLQIDNQTFGNIRFQRRKKFPSGSESPRQKRARAQQPAQGLEDRRIVVHNCNPQGSFRHERLLRSHWPSVDWPLGQQGLFPLLRKIEFFGHTNEISYGANAEFLHHPAAMNLDGLLDGAQIAGNLLVEASCHDMY